MIQCIRSSSWTGYMLVKVRHDLPEVGFVKFLGSHHFLLIMKHTPPLLILLERSVFVGDLLLNIRTPSVLARHLDENVNMFCALSSQLQNKHKQ